MSKYLLKRRTMKKLDFEAKDRYKHNKIKFNIKIKEQRTSINLDYDVVNIYAMLGIKVDKKFIEEIINNANEIDIATKTFTQIVMSDFYSRVSRAVPTVENFLELKPKIEK